MKKDKILLIPRIFDEVGEIPNFTKELLEKIRQNHEIYKGDNAVVLVYSTPTGADFKFYEKMEKEQKKRIEIAKKKKLQIYVDEVEKDNRG